MSYGDEFFYNGQIRARFASPLHCSGHSSPTGTQRRCPALSPLPGDADDGGDSGLNAVPDERGRILRGAGCRRRGAGFRGCGDPCGVVLVLILRLVSCKQYY